MSDRDIDINLDRLSVAKTIFQEPTPEAVREYEAKMLQIYDNGLVIDRLQVPLPDDVHGEWVHPDFADRLRELGFINAPEEILPKTVNDSGHGAKTLDVIFMILPKWKKDVMDKNRARKYYESHIMDRRRKKEEKDFEQQNEEIGMPTVSKKGDMTQSEMNVVSGTEIAAILNTKT